MPYRTMITRLHSLRPGSPALAFLLLALLAFAGTLLHGAFATDAAALENRERVRTLGLTDLCLSTEARYTRHLSQADYHTPFQDHPVALEHFPSGTLIAPPPHLRHAPLSR